MGSDNDTKLEKAVGVTFREYDPPQRNISRCKVFGVVGLLAGFLFGPTLAANGCTYHVYKTLVEAREENCGRAHAVRYAYDAIRELHEEVPPDVREVRFVAVENYLGNYVESE